VAHNKKQRRVVYPDNWLRIWREEHGITIRQMVEWTGLGETTIRDAERGYGCRRGVRMRILGALGLSVRKEQTIWGPKLEGLRFQIEGREFASLPENEKKKLTPI